jgi:[protein-PII] uridylyltransferase
MARCGSCRSKESGGSAPGRRGLTRSRSDLSSELRAARDRLIGDRGLRGEAFGRALSESLDETLAEGLRAAPSGGRFALLAAGSYGRAELCPGSDVDLLLLHEPRAQVAEVADELWYPLWDAGFVLGHAARTVKAAIALADADLQVLTSLLDARLVAGDERLFDELVARVHALAVRRRARLVEDLAAAMAARRDHPGPVSEMLEPNLKDGAGGLRDLQAFDWVGWALGPPGGVDALVGSGFLQAGDRSRLEDARARLLDLRVALHRTTGGRGDVLLLQEQDTVARLVEAPDADVMARELAGTARTVAWIAGDAFDRLRSAEAGPAGRGGGRERELAPGVVLRDGRVALGGDDVGGAQVLRAAAAAAELDVAFDRAALERCADVADDFQWSDDARESFVALLRAGASAVPVFEALDQVGALTLLLPEWEHVRFLPQRNAYHRYTVDRHLLEAVAECAALLDDDGLDGDVARRARTDLLLLGALLHDIGKGRSGDHSDVGAATAAGVARRMGFADRDVATLEWLVRHHLLLADTATRRDLSDERTIARVGRTAGTTGRLDLLYALTVGDSRATGPAAWGPGKAALVRELFVKTDALLEEGVVGPAVTSERAATLERHAHLFAGGGVAVEWSECDDDVLECAVAAPDRTGLLADVAGVLALYGFDVRHADAYSHSAMALEVFRGGDRFGRLADAAGRAELEATLRGALDGTFPVASRLQERIQRYRKAPGAVSVIFDLEASGTATVVEVHAVDEVALLARLAATFADLGLDVRLAKVATLGERVVDVFYVVDGVGQKLTDPLTLDRLKATIMARLATDYALP